MAVYGSVLHRDVMAPHAPVEGGRGARQGPLQKDFLETRVIDAPDSAMNFILDAWKRSYRSEKRNLPWNRYSCEVQSRLNALIARGARVRIAVDGEDEDFFFGFIVAEPPVLHYVYVKSPFRRQGLAIRMIEESGFDTNQTILCPYWTPAAKNADDGGPIHFHRLEL